MKAIVGIATRQAKDNPHYERCITSLRKFDPGLNMMIICEQGKLFTRGEKRQRVFTQAKAENVRYVCILEDDTEIIDEGWLWKLCASAMHGNSIGLVNPLEARFGSDEPSDKNALPGVVDVTNAFGFCMLYDMQWGPTYDPRISYLDDFAMSMQCRAAGYRVARTGLTVVRHTKQPFSSDDTPPWEQPDRERWGEDSIYYNADKFFEARVSEAELLIEQYGEMATWAMPQDLIKGMEEKNKSYE